MSEPRDLKLTITTSEADRIAGQPILFLERPRSRLGQQRRRDTRLGDGSRPLVSNAERVRQSQRLEHIYATVQTVHPVAVARDRISRWSGGANAKSGVSEMGAARQTCSCGPLPQREQSVSLTCFRPRSSASPC
jgi:hypothetical protein